MNGYPSIIIVDTTGRPDYFKSACHDARVFPSITKAVKISEKAVEEISEMLDLTKHGVWAIYKYIIIDTTSDHELATVIVEEVILKFPSQKLILIATAEEHSVRHPRIKNVPSMKEAAKSVRDNW